jgi:subtilase family serine protease
MTFRSLHASASIAALVLLASSAPLAFSLSSHNVATGLAMANDQGRVEPGKEMNLTVVLKLHNRAEFDKAVESLYDPASPTYQQWFTAKDFEKYAPTAQEFETVRRELVKQGFTVVSSDPDRFSLRVHGTAATVEKAFQTELHTFAYGSKTFQAHVRDAMLLGAAGELVDSVAGIERHIATPQLSAIHNPNTGKLVFQRPLATKAERNSFVSSFTDAPLTKSSSESFSGDGITTKFGGLQYGANGLATAFTPAQLRTHYGLDPLIKAGYNGAGQTIALVEGFGYPTAQADANTAAAIFGLPALTSANFSVIFPEGPPQNPNDGILEGWDTEIALDIQSAHAIAPGAKILVVASAGQDDEDQIYSLNYIITHKLASAVSSSWENDSEIVTGKLQEEAFNTVLEKGAAAGISFQFSSGDSGDLGLGSPIGAVNVPSNSPFATAVGGTSVLNNPVAPGQIVTGWGDNIVYLYDFGPFDPLEGVFDGGAGGGVSQFYDKPSWQNSLPGSWRRVPDVAALADPFTGFPIVVTQDGELFGEIFGGTSLASPIFTANWAIADQYNGKALGFAAPLVSRLKAGEILDVTVQAPSIVKFNVTGVFKDTTGTTTLNARQVFNEAIDINNQPDTLNLYTQTRFLSAIWPGAFGNPASELDAAIAFGTDSSLTVTPGWDEVTGWGEPNGLHFIQGVTGKTVGAKLQEK